MFWKMSSLNNFLIKNWVCHYRELFYRYFIYRVEPNFFGIVYGKIFCFYLFRIDSAFDYGVNLRFMPEVRFFRYSTLTHLVSLAFKKCFVNQKIRNDFQNIFKNQHVAQNDFWHSFFVRTILARINHTKIVLRIMIASCFLLLSRTFKSLDVLPD